MQFLGLLSLMAGVIACSAAVLAGRNAGWLDLLIGWVIGLVIGLGCCLGMWSFGKWAIRRLKLNEPKPSPFRLILSWLLCLVAVVWMIISGIIATLLTKAVVHLCQ
jgi:hypothetical protein